ncbi:hypothetical protein ACQPTN_05330 [Bradyrhizobium sp. 13971]
MGNDHQPDRPAVADCGRNPYRVKAYLRAATSLSALSQQRGGSSKQALPDIMGIGDAIADMIAKLYETGSHPSLEKLRKNVPRLKSCLGILGGVWTNKDEGAWTIPKGQIFEVKLRRS